MMTVFALEQPKQGARGHDHMIIEKTINNHHHGCNRLVTLRKSVNHDHMIIIRRTSSSRAHARALSISIQT